MSYAVISEWLSKAFSRMVMISLFFRTSSHKETIKNRLARQMKSSVCAQNGIQLSRGLPRPCLPPALACVWCGRTLLGHDQIVCGPPPSPFPFTLDRRAALWVRIGRVTSSVFHLNRAILKSDKCGSERGGRRDRNRLENTSSVAKSICKDDDEDLKAKHNWERRGRGGKREVAKRRGGGGDWVETIPRMPRELEGVPRQTLVGVGDGWLACLSLLGKGGFLFFKCRHVVWCSCVRE